MAKNLFYQMHTSIENGFRPGMDKHSIKKQANNQMDYKIYSYASRKELIDFAHRFSDFIKENYPTIKQVKNIGIEQVNAYLSSKTNVTQKTMEHEVSCINKLQLCCNRKFGISIDWKTDREVPKTSVARKRDVAFTDEQIKGLKEYFATKRDCCSKTAFFLGERFALRASEITKLQVRDIKWNENILHIHDSKGKRSRDIPINVDDKKFLRELCKDKKNNDRLIPLRSDSICAYLNRACKQLGYSEIIQAKTSYHALRKYSVSKKYQKDKEKYGTKKAREKSMEYLGHSKNRSDLYKTYIFS